MARIKVEAEIRPTEDEEKVRRAVLNVFEPTVIEVVGEGRYKRLVAESRTLSSLEKLHSLLRQERVLDAARKKLRQGRSRGLIVFKLHKQAAYAGHISFVDSDDESPLGAITFTIEAEDPGEIIDWLAPRTSHGKPLWEKRRPGDNAL
jgi:predicted RNA binding protein with dsRBD fold (UPF0201 family)